MKRKLQLLAVLFTCFLTTIAQTGGQTGDLTWELSTSGVLTISGNGRMADYTTVDFGMDATTPWFRHRQNIKEIVIEPGVKYIGHYAFYRLPAITTAELPESVERVGNYVFCESGLQTITLHPTLKSIGHNMFKGSQLTSFTIPAGLTELPGNTFRETPLTSIHIPANIKKMGESVFYICRELVSVTFEEGCRIPGIEAATFGLCSNLQEINLPESVISIGSGAFSYCSRLASVRLPASLTYLGREAFRKSGLTSLDMPASLTHLETYALLNCYHLKAIHVDEANPYFSSENGVLFNKDKTELVSYPGAKVDPVYIVPASVRTLGNYAFAYSLPKEIILPDGLESIGILSFSTCYNLESLHIPASVQHIEQNAFYVDLQNGGKYGMLKQLIVEWEKPLELSFNSFLEFRTPLCQLVVPDGTGQLYAKAKVWQTFGDIIEESEQNLVALEEMEISFPQEVVKVGIGATIQLSLSVYPLNADVSHIVWYSSNEKVATVNQQGMVTIRSAGETVIEAVTTNGKVRASCPLVVNSEGVTTANKVINPDAATIFTEPGAVVVNLQSASPVKVYQLAGRLVYARKLGAGQHRFNLAPGMYILATGKESFRFMIYNR